VGVDPNNQFGGHSLVVDSLGNILIKLDDTETIGRVTINHQEVAKTRGQMPVLEDRRTDLY